METNTTTWGNLSNETTEDSFLLSWEYESPVRFQPLWFEKHDIHYWRNMFKRYESVPLYICAVYLTVVFGIQHIMKTRQRFELRKPLAVWNLGLGVFSAFGFCRTLQELVRIWSMNDGVHRSLCYREMLNEPASFWAILFALSKVVELGDTLFIVLKKNPVVLLQWYHHCLTLCLAWKLLPLEEPIARWYGLLNFGVHACMYPYFGLRALGYRPKTGVAFTITTLQIGQMATAVLINIYTFYIMQTGGFCMRHPTSMRWSSVVFGSFLVLFVHFFIQKYFGSKTKQV